MRAMAIKACGVPAMIAAVLLGLPAAVPEARAIALTDAERQHVCAEAEGRYRQIHGKPSANEPFVVVLMYKDNFCPRNLSLKRGTRLRWINVDRRTSHSVWFKDAGRPESDRLFPEEFVEMLVDFPPGAYPYLCGPHWEKEGMTGELTVREN